MDTLLLYWREIFAFIAVAIALHSYVVYIRSIFAGTTEPHVVSWGIWAMTTGIAFFAQIAGGGGWGAAQAGVTAIVCIVVMGLAIKYGTLQIHAMDYYSIFLACTAIILWRVTDNPFYASLFAMVADSIGYIPTFRKVWHRPHSEPSGYYLLMNLKHIFSLLALSQYNWTTMIFSGSIVIINFCLVGLQILRKKSLGNTSSL